MREETAGTDIPAADTSAMVESPAPATGEQSEAQTGEVSADQTETDATIGDDAAAKPKKKHWAYDRIDELTRQRREAERQADYWKQRASQTVDPNSLEYEEGIAERVSQRHRQEQADTARATAEQLAAETFSYRETMAREKFADYDTVTRNPNVPITPAMLDIIRDSDVGPDLAYHLARNVTEAARIAALPLNRQAVELGKLEAKITAPKATPKQPPAPVQPVNGIAAGGSKDPGTMTMAEYAAWRKANS